MIIEGYRVDDGRSSRSQFKTNCPRCIELGKKADMSLSINRDSKMFNCHKCGWKGYYGEKTEAKSYKLPDTVNLTDMKLEHLQWMSRRFISQDVVKRNRISSAKGDWIAFPYYDGDIVVNIKYKNVKEKKFMQAPEAKHIMYKLNDIRDSKTIIVCEGEEEALSWEEAGYVYSTSVSQGAPNVNDKDIEKKLACVYNCFDVFEQAEVIYIATDNDPNGQRLQRELIGIFGAEKCRLISFEGIYKPDGEPVKDANDVLKAYGKEALIDLYNSAKDVQVEGIFDCSDSYSSILYDYQNGQPKGTTTHFDQLDRHFTHRLGEVTIWTGYNNEGKSLFLKQLLLLKSHFDGWKHAVFTPEEMPLHEWFTDLIEMYVGKSADKTQEQFRNYMTESQLKMGADFLNEKFFAVYPDEEKQDIDTILSKCSYLVRKKRIQTVVLDPYNQIHHVMKSGEREDLYISRFMSKLKRFAVTHNVAVHLVAHQLTPEFAHGQNFPKPNIYKIKGGGTFSDKADNVVIVWREHRNTDPTNTEVKVVSQKIKKQKLTGVPGEVVFEYDRRKNRYLLGGESPLDKNPNTEIKMEFAANTNFYEAETPF